MGRPFRAIRPDERRDTWAAFLTLFGFLASHSILETARDALFLAKVPARNLPWVFLAIAGVSLVVTNLQARLSRTLSGRPAVAAWTVVAAVVTFAFWWLLGAMGSLGLYALYVWSGVLTSLVLVHFWTLLGNMFSVTQAKRLYGFIGAGSVLGAIVGSGTAGVLSRFVAPGQLLLASSAGFMVTSALPLLFKKQGGASVSARGEPAAGLLENARYVARQPYARAVVLLMVSSTTALTIADYLFKSTVALSVPKADLGTFLATVYLGLNILSLLTQVFLVSFIVRRFAISTALAVLPAFLIVGGLGMAATAGLIAALVIKTADGALRYSLHRTTSELLFLPFSDEARRRVKGFIDVVGQRGGQVLASIAILTVTALATHPRHGVKILAAMLAVVATIWFANALALHAPYMDLFRSLSRASKVQHLDAFPQLDVASLETLVASLDSPKNNEVTAALDVLEREKKVHLVPALILYHPADEVVERALSIFTRAKRTNVTHVIDRLLEHPSPRVRAATIAARSVLNPDAQRLLLRMSFEESPEVRATIVVNLIASGEIFGSDARERVDGFLQRGSQATRVALAEAIARREAHGFSFAILAMAKSSEVPVRLAAISAMGRLKSSDFFPALLDLHSDEVTRRAATRALFECGEAAFAALILALADENRPALLRGRFPDAMSQFDPGRAASSLLARLPKESDGSVRYRILRALESITRKNPGLTLDRPTLVHAIEGTVSRAYRYLDRRLIVERGVKALPSRATPGQKVLVRVLRDKEQNAIERLFRLLTLAYPGEDFVQIYRGIRIGRKDTRASSMELIENALDEPLRRAVLGLVDDGDGAERLLASGRYHTPLGLDYVPLLEHILKSTSRSLQDVTVFHVGELQLQGFYDLVASLPRSGGPGCDITRTLALLTTEGGKA